VICVASAGNTSENEVPLQCNPAPVPFTNYPASYPGVIAVSATHLDEYDVERFRDNYNYNPPDSSWFDLSAPGEGIWTTDWSGGYVQDLGTSLSSPQVAALAGLILTLNPSANVTDIMTSSADKIDQDRYTYDETGWNDHLGYGRINAFKALFRTKGYGHITTNVTWYNGFELKGDVIVDEGVTLTIEPSVTVTFPYGAEMHVYGTLIAEGESDNQIVFHSQSSSNSYIVRFYNSTSSASNLEYCTFQNATKGIYIDDSDINVSNCEVTDCTYGIYNNYAEPTLYDNSISSCTYAIYNYWSDSDIKNNELNYSSYGIYNYRSSPDIYGNELIGGAFGIRCNSYSSPQLAKNQTPGYNYVHDNFMIGLYAEYNSHPFMGYDYCDITGNNSFVDNETGQVSAVSSSSILAELNWWGTSSPPSGWFSGNVDYTPYLASPPGEGLRSPEEEEFDIAFKNTDLPNGLISQTAMSIYDKNWSLWKKTRFARALIYNGDPDDALTICKDIIAQNPDSTLAFYALDLVWQASRLINKERGSGLNDFTDYLELLSNQKNSKLLYGSAELLLAGFERENGLARVESVFNNYRQTYLAEEALFQKFMFYFNESEDFSMVKSIIDDMDKLFPKSTLTFQAHHLFGDPVSGWSELSITQETANILETANADEISEMIPDKYELVGVFPNPFNPSTRIRYAIPQLSQIEVDIYNMLGQKVKGFRIDAQQPGIYDLVWDGMNDANVRVSSGLYIIQFKATSLEDQTEVFGKSVKVTLLK
jgi:parallel beta-helix repeat protein